MINSLAERQTYRFQGVEVDISRGCIVSGGEERHLRQKTFQVLVYLLEQRERLVTKDELINVIWKDVAVTDDVLVQCIKEIRRALGDNPHQPRFIKTVPKSGYRFIGVIEDVFPVIPAIIQTEEITRVELEFEEDSDSPPIISATPKLIPVHQSRFNFKAKNVFAFAVVLILLAAVGLAFYHKQDSSVSEAAEIRLPHSPGKKAIAVMFFENHSKTEELDWLREGLADMLIADLSRSEQLTVLSRQQLFLLLERGGYKAGSRIDLEKALEIARKSGAEFFLVGSFARLGEKVRLDLQMHNAQTGGLEAAESLTVDRPEQILTEIDLLSLKLLNRLNAAPKEKSNLASVMTDNLEAYRYYSLALEKARGLHKMDALEFLNKAVALDPEFAMAHARIGYVYAVTWGWAEKAKPHLERAFQMSKRLTEKDRLYITAWYAIANLDYPSAITTLREIIQKYPMETEAYLRLGYLLRGEEQFDEAINVMRQGLTIDPDSSALYNSLGLLYSILGRHDEAIAMHRRYVALEPNEANARDSLGMSYQWAGRYDDAIAEYNRSLELNPKFEIAYAHLGAAYCQTGRYRTAIDWFKKYIAVAPSDMESARGYSYIAHAHRKLKNQEAAIQAAKQAIKDNEFYVGEMIHIALESGDQATAEKLEEKIFAEPGFTNRGSRGSPRYRYYFRGLSALKKGRGDEAIENFRKALRHSASTWEVDPFEDCLANAYLELGRFDEAIAEYERVLRLNPNYPLARFHLAQAFERKGMSDKAAENYKLFLQIWNQADEDIPELNHAQNFLRQN